MSKIISVSFRLIEKQQSIRSWDVILANLIFQEVVYKY